MTTRQLNELHSKESDHNVGLEKELTQLRTRCKQLEEVEAALRASEEQLRVEKETEVENLEKHLDSLRKRQEQTQNQQLKQLEEENRYCHTCNDAILLHVPAGLIFLSIVPGA